MLNIVEVKSISGMALFEIQHNGAQTLSEPFTAKADAEWYRLHLLRMRGTSDDPLADYWKRQNTKVSAHLYEVDEGSDDPRAIQGGGGPSEKLVGAVRNSRWLIEAYVRAYYNRYGDRLVVRYLRG